MVVEVPEMFTELVRYRGLLAMLAWRDIRVRYKQSLLGVAWAWLMPLLQTAVLFAIFQFGPMKIDSSSIWNMPYLLFVLSGVIPWTLFNTTLASTTESLTRNARLVTKIYFPREVFPLATLAGSLVDFLIALTVAIPFYIYFVMHSPYVHVSWMLALLPLILLIEVVFLAGLSLIISMANLFFRDVKYIMSFVLQLWFFATNVMYPIRFKEHPALQSLASFNPLIAVFNAYRSCLMGNGFHPGEVSSLMISGIVSVVVLLCGWWSFHRAEFRFAEYV